MDEQSSYLDMLIVAAVRYDNLPSLKSHASDN